MQRSSSGKESTRRTIIAVAFSISLFVNFVLLMFLLGREDDSPVVPIEEHTLKPTKIELEARIHELEKQINGADGDIEAATAYLALASPHEQSSSQSLVTQARARKDWLVIERQQLKAQLDTLPKK